MNSATETRHDVISYHAERRSGKQGLWAVANRWLFPLALILVPAVACFLLVRANGINVPYMDEWGFIGYLRRWQAAQLNLIEFVNVQDAEHKCFVPYMIQLLLADVSHYNEWAFFYFNYTLVCAQCLLYFLIALPLVEGEANKLLLLSPISWLAFSVAARDCLLDASIGMNLTCTTLIILTIYLIKRSASLDLFLALAFVSALGATYCCAPGVLVWPLGWIQLVLRRVALFGNRGGNDRANENDGWLPGLGAWTAVSAMVLMIYISHLNLAVHTANDTCRVTPELLKHDLSAVIQCALALMGGPLSADLFGATAAGFVLAVLCLSAVWPLFKAAARDRVHAIPGIVLFLFAALAAGLITVGRAGAGLHCALAAKYCSYTNLGVAGLYLLVLALRHTAPTSGLVRLGVLIGLMGFGALSTWQTAIHEGDITRGARLMLANALRFRDLQSDDSLYHLSGGVPFGRVRACASLVRRGADYLEGRRMSIFAEPRPPDLERLSKTSSAPTFLLETINSLPVHTYPLQKHVVLDRKTQPTLNFAGWAIDFEGRGPCPAVYLNIDNQTDIPSGVGIPRRELVRAFRRNSYLYSGFGGTFRSDAIPAGVHTVSLKIVRAGGKTYYQSGPLVTLEVL